MPQPRLPARHGTDSFPPRRAGPGPRPPSARSSAARDPAAPGLRIKTFFAERRCAACPALPGRLPEAPPRGGAGRRGVSAAAIGGPGGRGGAGERRSGGGAAAKRGGGGGMVDSVYRTRSLGVAAEGLPDQYADGRAAKVWQLYIGDTRSRTAEYRSWLLALLRQHRCRSVLDVACGTG